VWPERSPYAASPERQEAHGHFDRIDRVIAGCLRDEQLESARNMVAGFKAKFPDSKDLQAVLENRVRDKYRSMRWEGRKAYMISLGFEYREDREYNFVLPGVWSCPRGQVENPSDEEFLEYVAAVKEAMARKGQADGDK
jgi:hypothetical protein